MGKTTGFKEFSRAVEPYRPAKERVLDFKEIYTDHDDEKLAIQGARCMDCGVPFCQSGEGCPVYNLIPEWNDLVYQNKWEEAFDKLMLTNNFPRSYRTSLPGSLRRCMCFRNNRKPCCHKKSRVCYS